MSFHGSSQSAFVSEISRQCSAHLPKASSTCGSKCWGLVRAAPGFNLHSRAPHGILHRAGTRTATVEEMNDAVARAAAARFRHGTRK